MSRVAILLLALAMPGAAWAQLCEARDTTGEELQYLRRLSLDLRGRVPTLDELQSVIDNGAVDPATIDAFLASDDFLHQMRQHHRDLLWANLGAQRLANNQFLLQPSARAPTPPLAIPAQNRRNIYRGGNVACRDEPAEFDREGNIVTIEEPDPAFPDRTVRREGYVEVEPYWAPGTTVKVCAFDAQVAEQGTNPRNPNARVNCRAGAAQDCGCGPGLSFCFTLQTMQRVVRMMTEQLLQTVDAVVAADRPYTDLVLGTETVVNGPLVHYFTYQTATGINFVAARPDPGYALPEIGFDEEDWLPVTTSGLHAGVLTLPGYLLRFQSDRGRANRFYNAFLCQSFQAPPEGLPASSDDCHDEPDLTKRCGCAYCHVAVEPAAMHWGRWSEAGLAELDTETFPIEQPACATPRGANSPLCRRFYLTAANHPKEEPYLGTLLPYVFGDDHPDRAEIIEAGPRRLAQQAVDSGRFANCTVRKLWTRLLGRAPRPDEDPTIAELASDFAAGGYVVRDLARTLVTRREYVEAGHFTGEVAQ